MQFFVSRLTTLHRRETRDPQLDDIRLAVEIFRQLTKREVGQGSIILLGDGHARDLAVHGGIKHGDFNPGIHRFLHQRGGVRIAPLRENNPVVFLADGLVNEVLESGVVAVAQKGADLKAKLLPFLNRPGNKLRGIVVRAEVADHRDADRAVVVGNGSRNRRGRGRKARQSRE